MVDQRRKHTFEDSIAEIRAMQDWDASNWRVILAQDTKRYMAYVPDFSDCMGDDTSIIKTNRLDTKKQAESIATVLNALSEGTRLDEKEAFMAFICLLKDADIWR